MAMFGTRSYSVFGDILDAFLILLVLSTCCLSSTITTDSLLPNKQISDGQTIVSANETFTLGFFSPGTSTYRYVGIWYSYVPNRTVVWVANRNNPVLDTSGILMFDTSGNLVILDGRGSSFTVAYGSGAKDTEATILDSGNLVLRSVSNRSRLRWQSFDYPTDTWLQGMNLGFVGAQNQLLTSWRSSDDPAIGDYSFGMDPNEKGDFFIWERGNVYWKSGLWNGQSYNFTESESMSFLYVSNDARTTLSYSSIPASGMVSGLCLGAGQREAAKHIVHVELLASVPEIKTGKTVANAQKDLIQEMGLDGLVEIPGEDDKCSLWYGNIMNLREGESGDAVGTFYLRLAASELESRGTPVVLIAATVSSVAFLIFASLIFLWMWRQKSKAKGVDTDSAIKLWESEETEKKRRKYASYESAESILGYPKHAGAWGKCELWEQRQALGPVIFGFEILWHITMSQSLIMLQGNLPEGQEIAVKRLAAHSGQGLLEFKNEIMLIAKLQHRNLVRLLGCCIQGEEKILIYEYMPNKKQSRREMLDWATRITIIEGIAQGLLYLHKHSRFRIIHRDLKASNILLDIDMNPKISDFGMARIFGSKETEANTNRVVGTYGYMAPEYAMEGIFSVKSDVFSFGVLLLEIVSGIRNAGFHQRGNSLNLLCYAWELWKEGRWSELADPSIYNACPEHKESPINRPTMTEIISALDNESTTLPEPKQPAFVSAGIWTEAGVHGGTHSINGMTISDTQATGPAGSMSTRAPRSLLPLLFVAAAVAFFSRAATAADVIGQAGFITGNQTLVSSGGVFELGFFVPNGATDGRRYLGIWYASIPGQTVVWVANRQDPVVNVPAVARLSADGRLVIVDAKNTTVWSSPAPARNVTAAGATARLQDDGNLVVSSGSPGSVAWQSFDYPTDTLLPGMKLGVDVKNGITRNMTSWTSSSDPSPGSYTFKLVPGGLPEFFLFRGPTMIYGSGPWNGAELTGVPDLKSQDFAFTVVSSPDETYYSYSILNPSLLSRFVADATAGQVQRFVWINGAWSSFWYYPTDPCDGYAKCGAFGYCDTSTPTLCSCLPGFQPRSPQQWGLRDASGGCVLTANLTCGAGDGFWTVNRMKLPAATNATVYAGMTLDQCRQVCLGNCSCRAYAAANVSGGVSRGCVIWAVDLLDMRQYPGVVQDVYIRLAQSEVDALNAAANSEHPSNSAVIAVVIATISGVLLLGAVGGWWFWRNRLRRRRNETAAAAAGGGDDVLPFRVRNQQLDVKRECDEKDLDLPLLDLKAIVAATDDFAASNKIGEGGFGPVYMGKLEDGQEVAVKRLSRRSVQGVVEFKNEVKLIAKLQHRNLVRLLGCCIDDDERMLVYEYMHNQSLDTFIFDEGKRKLLRWSKRFEIIVGVARGLLYLHEDSRFRIIHRDLKASNVLLDRNMVPKISDFGIARMFGGDQTTAYTRKVIGTYGYMSPEYAMDGVFSMKSDVYSFGVLVLEIVSGRRNRGFYEAELDLNLLRYSWLLWKEGRSVDLLDQLLGGSFDYSEVLRCIQVALLCVEVQPRNRPLMSSVVMMLASENATLPEPNEPGVNIGRHASDTESSETLTVNGVTITEIECRRDQSMIGRFGDKRDMRRRRALALLVTMAFFSRPVIAVDRIGLTASIIGKSTLESAKGVFKLGFFTPLGGKGTYLGIWYANIQSDLTVVWVANRQHPVINAPGVVTLSANGLVIVDAQNTTVWSSPVPAGAITAGATARLHDDGNFAVSSDGSDSQSVVLWQSFDYPTDTLLPGMKLGEDRKKGITRNITSWSSPTDPSPGKYTFKLVLGGLPEFFLFDNSKTTPIYASGPWNGETLTGVPGLKSQQAKGDFTFTVLSSPEETYYNYSISNRNPSFLTRFFVDGTEGKLQRIWSSDDGKSWINNKNSYPIDPCDNYGSCGAFGYCVYTEGQPQQCNCLPGFQSLSAQGSFQDTSKGCARITNLTCGDGDGFWRVNRMKLPDATKATVHAGMTLDQCRQECLRNCSCNAYAAAAVSGGVNRGCVIWTVGLMDMRKYPKEFVQDLYIRLPQSQIDALNAPARRRRLIKNVVIAVVTTICGILGVVGCCCLWRNKMRWKRHSRIGKSSEAGDIPFRVRKNPASSPARDQWFDENNTSVEDDLDLPLFDLEMIFDATDRFAANNKIGEGGFGPVYLGRLEDGQEVAVKRLSRRSVQGVVEFKNEVKLIAKLQHRNLVRLLGCCIDDNERVLVYEYMHNKSLDTFIFDEGNRKLLSWNKRFEIILGIARGLLYLHEDSRFRIIHRDLKASNVLLDRNMVPKVSDFGIARMFEGDQTTAYTGKVIGTYGYMSPEYAMDGVFSMKSDVFSFGVLVLEIVAGRRNRGFCESELNLNLLRYAWMLWKEGKSMNLLDELIGDIFDDIEVLRCIHVALLCVEVEPKNRPLMSSVVMMLASENATLPQPNEPGVNIGKITSDTESSHGLTSNSVTITTIEAR
uniref:non-specific serine/threonine protein kinase n=1 Tax=Oryza barthii TaxID=65489 RepID=A0A0D3EUU4_9ORYZ